MQELYFLIPLLIIGGAAAGVLAGLFGIGGGTLLVPVLYEVARYTNIPPQWDMQVAVGTSLAVIALTSVSSYFSHKKKGVVDSSVLRQWRWPIPLGVALGAMCAAYLPSVFLKSIFAIICALTALRFLLDPQGKWRLGHELPSGWLLKIHGVLIGFLSSLMGLGGGIFAMLLLTLYNRPIHQAVAVSAGVGILVSIPGAIGYMIAGSPYDANFPLLSVGFVAFLAVIIVAPLSVLTAPLGVKLAHRFNKRQLEIAFAVYLLLIAGRFAVSLFGF